MGLSLSLSFVADTTDDVDVVRVKKKVGERGKNKKFFSVGNDSVLDSESFGAHPYRLSQKEENQMEYCFGHFVEEAFYRIAVEEGLDIVHCQGHAFDLRQGTDMLLFVGQSEFIRIDITMNNKMDMLLPNGEKQVPMRGKKAIGTESGYAVRIGNSRGLFREPVLLYQLPHAVFYTEGEEEAFFSAIHACVLQLRDAVDWYQSVFA